MYSGTMTPEQHTRGMVNALRKDAHTTDRWITERLMDDLLVNHAGMHMRTKLDAAREKGRGGWWNPDECSIEYLKDLLYEHLAKGDMRDVMNLAAMIHIRRIADEPQP